ncbi:MAG: Hpt domain-containing protein [Sphaerochaetaceae bacterium]|nr:Hpt domain-containing protein [Sphaerochaetaceae bacterium]
MNSMKLRQAGIDYEAGVRRFLGDKELYETVLTAFLADTAMERALSAFARHDRASLFASAHELKGSSGNADMTDVYATSCALVSLLRDATSTDDEIADSFMRLKEAYVNAMDGIREASEDR